MRHLLVAASTLGLVLASGAAFAQSGQGGYLGKDPATQTPSTSQPPPAVGSGQGGYLGKDPGGAATSSSGGAGATTGSGQGGYLGQTPGQNQGETTYGVPGKVGGRDNR